MVSSACRNRTPAPDPDLRYRLSTTDKPGKKQLRTVGNVEIPQSSFLSVLKSEQ
ncbi:MAG: hypothetical protein D3910_17045 [Candidatus Electrothrix sp. ATG2]|nr:hypothetical protein [Candidatus Electrothrix sp. ATG2]